MRELPAQAAKLCRDFEGFHRVIARKPVVVAVPYVCPAGFWTIGYGHLCGKDHPPIDQPKGERLLEQDLQDALAATLRYCPLLALESDERLAAIVDFTFNLGAGRLAASTLRRRVNAREWSAARSEIRRWVWGGGQKLPGLILRREAEAALLA